MKRFLIFLTIAGLLLGASWVAYKVKYVPRSQQPTLNASPFSPTDQQRLESGLGSRDTSTMSSVLTPDFAAALHGRRVFSAGATVHIQADTFRASGNYGIVNIVASKPNSHSALLAMLLVRQGSNSPWQVETLMPAATKTAYAVNAGNGGVAAANRFSATTSGCESPGRNVPVLFVHGFNEGQSVWGAQGQKGAMVDTISHIQSTKPNLFDYYPYSLQWVTNPNIGAALAARVLCLSQSSRAAGGSGKIIVVAHSMGGLALKEAIKEQPQIASVLGLIVTIATPNDGSTVDSRVTQAVQDACTLAGVLPAGILCTTATYTVLHAFTALPGLQAGSPEIKALPNWPAGVPVYAIAGDISPKHLVLLWDPLPHLESVQDNPSGQDTLVGVRSALHGQTINGLGGTQRFGCPTDSFLVLPFGLTSADCEHNALLHNRDVEDAVANQVRRYLGANRPPPTVPSPPPSSATAPQPVACGQTFNAGSGWQNATVRTTVQHGAATCSEAVSAAQQFLSSDIGSSGANQIGVWGCVLQSKPLAEVAGVCSTKDAEFTFTGT